MGGMPGRELSWKPVRKLHASSRPRRRIQDHDVTNSVGEEDEGKLTLSIVMIDKSTLFFSITHPVGRCPGGCLEQGRLP